jgi:hypothetical protein
MTTLSPTRYEGERDLFRQAAAEGLDAAMKDFAARQFRGAATDRVEGIRDKDLPAFFRVVDAAFDDALARYGFKVAEAA